MPSFVRDEMRTIEEYILKGLLDDTEGKKIESFFQSKRLANPGGWLFQCLPRTYVFQLPLIYRRLG
jgi:hypothetical protein